MLLVTFWHINCLKRNNEHYYIMNQLSNQYEIARQKANDFMKKGQISAYVNALLEMNKYKRLMNAVIAN